MMFRGRGRLGDMTVPAGGFITGAEVWQSPSAGFTAIQGALKDPLGATNMNNLPYYLGVLAVPTLLVFLVTSMGKR